MIKLCLFNLRYFKQLVYTILFLTFTIHALCQTNLGKSNPKYDKQKASHLYENALGYLTMGYIKETIPLLENILELYPNYTEAILSLAGAYGSLKDYSKSVKYYEIAKSLDSIQFSFYNLPYSINLAGMGLFKEARIALDNFLLTPDLSEKSLQSAYYRKKCYDFAIEFEKVNPYSSKFNPINVGDSVNSEYSEYFPNLTVDDTLLVFSRRENGSEYFYQSTKRDKEFSKARLITGDLNKERFKGAITLSADADWMFFAGDIEGYGFGSYDIYICYNTNDGWSKPENLGPAINSDSWESGPSISPDNRVLYFSSTRPGGYGGSDLYMSIRDSSGKWGNAINMGQNINTVGDEQAAFIHSDNQTLYFCSNGHPGYGGNDIYVVRKDEEGQWGIPQNLGYPINTIENEGCITVSSDGQTAYYASDRADSKGGLDLYRFLLRDSVRPNRTFYLRGRIYDSLTKKGLPCTVELSKNQTGLTLMKVQTDETGRYFITLPTGSDYTLTINRKGFFYYNRLYPLRSKLPDSTYSNDIGLIPIKINYSIPLNHIYFQINESQLNDSSRIELLNVLKLMEENKTMTICINGYTDNTGTSDANLLLSEKRAKAVVDYLIENGIEKTRVAYKGYGSAFPKASNDTDSGKGQNRRIELLVTHY